MKKDLAFIKEILNTFEKSNEPYLPHANVLSEIQQSAELSRDDLLKKYYYHITLLFDLNCLESTSENPKKMGFLFVEELDYINIDIRMTNNGHSMLIALNDDVIWKKLLNLGNKITNEVLIEAGKKVTALGLDKLFNSEF